jgi:hypothetical protein
MPLGMGPLGPQPVGSTGSFGRPAFEVIASAATIAPNGQFVRVTGNTNIVTITPPNPYFSGPLYVLNTDASVGATTTAGNIALATTLVRFKLLVMTYDPVAAKWYPSY